LASLTYFEQGLPQKWLPGETLFSLCSRYHAVSGNHLASTTCLALFGHKTQGCAHDFPARLNHFMTVAGSNLGSIDQIVETRTLLPLYLRFTSSVIAERVRHAAAHNSAGRLKFQLGLLTSRFRANHLLKACPTCMTLDRRDHLTSYWHREHQLPGVWLCRLHGCRLMASNLKATGVSRFQWILPSPPQFAMLGDGLPHQSSFALAGMVAGLVSRRMAPLSPQRLRETYRAGLRDQRLLSPCGRRLKRQKAGERYAAFVAPLALLEQLDGLPSTEDAAAAEIGRLIGPVRSGIHPLRHLSLATWLFENVGAFLAQYEAVKGDSEDVEAEQAPVEVALVATGQDDRKSRLVELLSAGTSVSRAAREIGIDTTTGMVWAAAQGIPTQRRPKLLTSDIRSALICLLRRGVDKACAAEAGRVSVQTITTLLRTEVGLRTAWKQAQFANAQRRNRRRWQRFIRSNPHSGVKSARVAEPAVFAWLYRNDRDWLAAQTDAMARAVRNPPVRVDWDSRDLHLSDAVRHVALLLAGAEPGRRIRLFQIYQHLPELRAKLFKLDQIPLTRVALFDVLGKSGRV